VFKCDPNANPKMYFVSCIDMCAMQGSFLNTVVSVLKRHVIVGSC
jgi:hypothetical protein